MVNRLNQIHSPNITTTLECLNKNVFINTERNVRQTGLQRKKDATSLVYPAGTITWTDERWFHQVRAACLTNSLFIRSGEHRGGSVERRSRFRLPPQLSFSPSLHSLSLSLSPLLKSRAQNLGFRP